MLECRSGSPFHDLELHALGIDTPLYQTWRNSDLLISCCKHVAAIVLQELAAPVLLPALQDIFSVLGYDTLIFLVYIPGSQQLFKLIFEPRTFPSHQP